MRALLSIACLGFGLQSAIVASQTLAGDQFNIRYSSAGLTSIKHVRDAYDTDYIAPGRSLGDVAIRYRKSGETDWHQAQSAHELEVKGRQVNYSIGRVVPTLATMSRTTSSAGVRGLSALNDQIEPKNSSDSGVPFFIWTNRAGTQEWVQYDFPKPAQVSSVEVYWAEFAFGANRCRLPSSWKLQYREGDQWQDIHADGEYGIAANQFDAVAFSPVTTAALRLLVQLPQNGTSGIFEWRVNTNEGKRIENVTGLAATERFQLDQDALLWTIEICNQTARPMEIGDLAIPLPFNTQYVRDKTETYTKRLIRHSFIEG